MEGWVELGQWLSPAYDLYVIALAFGLLGVHHLALAVHVLSVTRPRLKPWVLALELLYGFANPLLYLVVLRPALITGWNPWPLAALQWLVFAAYWSARWANHLRWAPRVRRGAARIALYLIAATAVRDLAWAVFVSSSVQDALAFLPLVVLLFPLYLLPAAIAEEDVHRGEDTFATAAVRWRSAVSLGALFLAGLLLTGWFWRPSLSEVRLQIAANRAHIHAAAREANLDPKLLASILLVTERQHSSQLERAAEALLAGLWLTDTGSHVLLSNAFDPSLGRMQVKPVTAMTALTICWNSKRREEPWIPSKSYRPVLRQGDAYKRWPHPQMVRLLSPLEPGAGMRKLVHSLLDDRDTFRWAAFILNVHATHWETTNPQWSIRDRPEILSTLYQLGFDRSHPKADPKANTFGEHVLAEYQGEWMRAQFE